MKHLINTPYAKTITTLLLCYVLSHTAMEESSAIISPAKNPCTICYEELYDKKQIVTQLPCSKKHAFHYSCIASWKAEVHGATCPLCRSAVDEPLGNPETIATLTAHVEEKSRDIAHLHSINFFRQEEIGRLKEKNKQLHSRHRMLKRYNRSLKAQMASCYEEMLSQNQTSVYHKKQKTDTIDTGIRARPVPPAEEPVE
jgi:hypothetical protein